MSKRYSGKSKKDKRFNKKFKISKKGKSKLKNN